MKSLLAVLLVTYCMTATAQDKKNDTTTSETSTSVIWLHTDVFTSLKSNFNEYAIGGGFRYEYLGLGFSRSRIAQSVYPLGIYYSERSFLDGYGFIPIGRKFAFYGMLSLWLDAMKTGDAGAGFQFLFGKSSMVGVGIHRDFDAQVFIGLQL